VGKASITQALRTRNIDIAPVSIKDADGAGAHSAAYMI
jgi:hypothetical protein